jgi:CheY-like chemotaxis protein
VSEDFRLSGILIMIVEDDPLIGLDLAMTLEDEGAVILGPYHSAPSALAALNASDSERLPGAALLDVDLGGHTSEAVARYLHEAGVPFAFHTAQAPEDDNIFAGIAAPVIRKPSNEEQIVAAVVSIAARNAAR